MTPRTLARFQVGETSGPDGVRRYDRIADKAIAAAIGGKLGERELDSLIAGKRRPA